MKVIPSPQWADSGTYKEPIPNTDNVRVPRLEVDDATTYVDKDGSNNLILVDTITGSKTLAELATGGAGGTPADTVAAETTFGISSSAGAATAYSRGDHTHGSPTNPVTAHALLTATHGVSGTIADVSDAIKFALAFGG